MMKRILTLLLMMSLLIGAVGCTDNSATNTGDITGTTSGTLQCEHSYEEFTQIKTPCIVTGEETAICDLCKEVISRPLPATGVHLYEGGVCRGCGQNEIPLTAVPSAADANGDGKNDVYYFSPLLSDRFENAVHVWAGDYDKSLSSTEVSSTTAGGLQHWYVGTVAQYIGYRVTVPEAGVYEMVIHLRMKDNQLRGTRYTVNAGTEHEEVFSTTYGFTGNEYETVREESTLTTYMYGITVNLVEGENTIRISQSDLSDKNQHYRDFYFVKVGEPHKHVFENEITVLEATCGRDGERTAICSCNLIRTTAIPATEDHQYVNELCSTCGKQYVHMGILGYEFLYDQPGFAGGTVSFMPAENDTYTFYWGDDNGRLADYTMLYSEPFAAAMQAEITIQSFTAIPKGATRLLAVGSNGKTTYSYTLPTDRLFQKTELYSFGALSDSHQGTRYGSQSIPYNHFIDAVKDLSQMGASIIGMSGDFTYNNWESEYKLHANAVKELHAYNSRLPIYTVSGNHESKNTGFSRDWFLKYSRNVVDYDTDMDPIFSDGNELDFVIELPDGSVMIYLNQVYYDYNTTASRLLDDYQLDWLELKLKQYQDRTVFLFFHTFIDEEAGDASTHTGKEYGLPLISGTVEYKRFHELFTKYKNVVFFSGHSHQSFDLQFMEEKAGDKDNLYTNIDNNNGTFATMVHIPSVAATRSGTGLSDAKTRSEGYLVRVYEDCILFEGYDFVNDQNFAYATYIIAR